MLFPTYQTPNKGFLGVLHARDPPWGPPETTPHFALSEEVEKCILGVGKGTC